MSGGKGSDISNVMRKQEGIFEHISNIFESRDAEQD